MVGRYIRSSAISARRGYIEGAHPTNTTIFDHTRLLMLTPEAEPHRTRSQSLAGNEDNIQRLFHQLLTEFAQGKASASCGCHLKDIPDKLCQVKFWKIAAQGLLLIRFPLQAVDL